MHLVANFPNFQSMKVQDPCSKITLMIKKMFFAPWQNAMSLRKSDTDDGQYFSTVFRKGCSNSWAIVQLVVWALASG